LARIPFPDELGLSPAQQKVVDEVVKGPRGVLIGPLRAALHRPDLADVWQRFGTILRFGTSLPPRLSELAIIVTAKRWNSQLEWYVHATAALQAGLSPEIIEDLRQGRSPNFADPIEADIYDFARELQLFSNVSDLTYARVRNRWGPVGVVELTSLVGYYTLVSMTLNAHDVPLPDDVQPPLPKPKTPAFSDIPEARRIAADATR
jgi:4-carboxymuconolactone decarboxylase